MERPDVVPTPSAGVRRTGPRGITGSGAALRDLTSHEEVPVDATCDPRLPQARGRSCASRLVAPEVLPALLDETC